MLREGVVFCGRFFFFLLGLLAFVVYVLCTLVLFLLVLLIYILILLAYQKNISHKTINIFGKERNKHVVLVYNDKTQSHMIPSLKT